MPLQLQPAPGLLEPAHVPQIQSTSQVCQSQMGLQAANHQVRRPGAGFACVSSRARDRASLGDQGQKRVRAHVSYLSNGRCV